MSRVFAILILSVHCLVIFRPFSPYLEYAVNYDYITKVLCENREKPELNCHGSCHLSKEIKKAMEKEEDPMNSSTVSSVKLPLFITATQVSGNADRGLELLEKKSIQPSTIVTQYSGKPATPPPKQA